MQPTETRAAPAGADAPGPTVPLPGSETLASLRRQWRGLRARERQTVGVVGAAALAGVIVWGALAARGPAMAPLFTNLQPADAESIVTQLSANKIPYRLAANGQTILVPQADVARERLAMAAKGLPSQGTVGLSSVLNLPFGATDFTRQVAYQDGLQGELEQTIDDIRGVSSSRVQIVMPQQATFNGSATPASAAVLVNLQPGASLDASQITGIVNLVAASVQQLSPSDITVIDQTGQVLWSQGQFGPAAATASPVAPAVSGVAGQAQQNLQVQQQFDQQLEQRLQTLLDQVFGTGNVIAQVNAQLSFDSGTVNKQLFEPPGSSPAVVQSMQKLQQTVVGSNTSASATPAGTAGNSQPVTTYPAGGGGGSSSTSNQLTEDFAVSQETDATTVAPGTISRLSVAVVVNSTLTAAQQQLVQQTVQSAVGYDAARQDQISVVGMPFNHSLLSQLQKQPAGPGAPGGRLPLPIVAAGAVLAALLVAGVLLLALRRGPGAAGADPYALPDGLPGAAPLGGALAADSRGEEGDPLGAALQTAQRSREKVEGALRQRPEDVARVIRAWLSNDE